MRTHLFLLISLTLAAPLVAATANTAPMLPRDYDLPKLADTPQHKPFRHQDEVNATARAVLEHYADHASAAAGYLDVTKAPYFARGDGVTDDTAALQRALDDARDARLVLWLPAGTYLVHDALQGVQGVIDWRPSPDFKPQLDPSSVGELPGAEDRLTAEDYSCVIEGPRGPHRAVIRLAADAKGFDDPARPRPVIYLWTRRWDPPYDCQPGWGFNQRLSNVDFDIRGHAGAIAVDMQGAQGSTLEQVHIEADGALAGLRGLIGSGGSTEQIAVHGGRFGVLAAGFGYFGRLTGSQPAPLVVGATLTGQTEAAIYYAGRGPLTVVGAHIEGRGIVSASTNPAYDGAINLIDSSLEIATGAAIASNRPVYIANSFVRGAQAIVQFGKDAALPPAGEGWSHVREFAGAPAGPYSIWIDGEKRTGFVTDVVKSATGPDPDLQSRHALPDLPAWNAAGIVNATAAPYGATGDNRTDDAPALQRALDENRTVFLPKGRYRLGRPLVLPPGRRLIGAGQTYTVLVAAKDAPAFADATAQQPLVDTAEDASADTVIAHLELQVTRPGAYALRWRAGARSSVCEVNFRRTGLRESHGATVRIEGGGGRWFNFVEAEQTHGTPDYRHLLVRGTRQPLTFYMFNPEHARSDVMTEFDDVRDVTIYSLKGETYEIGNVASGTRPLLHVRDSDGFRIFGAGGICGAASGSRPWVYRFENTHDILVTNLAHQHAKRFGPAGTWSMIVDVGGGREIRTSDSECSVLYRKK